MTRDELITALAESSAWCARHQKEIERLRDLTRIRDARQGELPAWRSIPPIKILVWEDDEWVEHNAGWYYCDGAPNRGAVQMHPYWLPAPEPPEEKP